MHCKYNLKIRQILWFSMLYHNFLNSNGLIHQMNKMIPLISNKEKSSVVLFSYFFSLKYFQIFFNIWIDHERVAWLWTSPIIQIAVRKRWEPWAYISTPFLHQYSEIQTAPQPPGSSPGLDFQKSRWCQDLEGPSGWAMGRKKIWCQE